MKEVVNVVCVSDIGSLICLVKISRNIGKSPTGVSYYFTESNCHGILCDCRIIIALFKICLLGTCLYYYLELGHRPQSLITNILL